MDNASATVTGEWRPSSSVFPYVGLDYIHDNNEDKGAKRVRFVPDLPRAGLYEIRFAYTANPNRATNVPVLINAADGLHRVQVSQRLAPGPGAPFVSLGIFPLPAGKEGYVEVGTAGTDGHVIADAVQWIPSGARSPASNAEAEQ